MNDNRTYTIFPSDLDLAAAFKKTETELSRQGFKENPNDVRDIYYSVRLQPQRSLGANVYSEFLETLEDYPSPESISIHSHWTKRDSTICLSISVRKSEIEVNIAGNRSDVLALHSTLQEVFHASNPEPDRSPLLSKYNLKKTVFLAHRFDELGMSLAANLRRFLQHLGFTVVEGEGYESRSIPEKIADRIRSQDILVLLVTSGDSTWILSEAAFAKALGKYIVAIVQEDASPNMGIIGADFEHISFPKDSVEKAFTDLLFALPT